MSATYRIGRISADRIDQAYPLAVLAAPTLSLNGWRTLCRNILNRDVRKPELDDIIIAINPRGYIQGLCVAAVRDHAARGRLLDVPMIVIASAADEPGVAAEIIEKLKVRARAEGCSSIRIWTLEKDGWTKFLSDREIELWDHGVLLLVRPNVS